MGQRHPKRSIMFKYTCETIQETTHVRCSVTSWRNTFVVIILSLNTSFGILKRYSLYLLPLIMYHSNRKTPVYRTLTTIHTLALMHF